MWNIRHIQNVSGGKLNILGGLNFGHSKQKKSMYMYPIPKSFGDRAISLYSSKIFGKKEILRTVSNTGIYCSSGEVGTWYNTFSKIPPSTSKHFATRVRMWRVACLYSVQCSVQWNSSISETVRNKTRAHSIYFCLEWPILWPPRILTFPPGTLCIYMGIRPEWYWLHVCF
jgi:hypothetical protein